MVRITNDGELHEVIQRIVGSLDHQPPENQTPQRLSNLEVDKVRSVKVLTSHTAPKVGRRMPWAI